MLGNRIISKRLYLINRDFQLRYTKVAVTVGLCSTALTVTLILLPLFHLNILRFPNFVPLPFVVMMAVASLINFAIIAMLGVVMTHRIAGPMFSLVRHMRQVQLGRLIGPLKVRESDDLKYLIRNFNEMLEYLVATTERDQGAFDKIIATLKTDGAAALPSVVAMAEGFRAELEARLPTRKPGQESS